MKSNYTISVFEAIHCHHKETVLVIMEGRGSKKLLKKVLRTINSEIHKESSLSEQIVFFLSFFRKQQKTKKIFREQQHFLYKGK